MKTWWAKKDNRRLVQHIPCGMLAAFLVHVMPVAGVLYFVGFWAYEYLQEWRKFDHSFKDGIGFLDGFTGLGVLIVLWERLHA